MAYGENIDVTTKGNTFYFYEPGYGCEWFYCTWISLQKVDNWSVVTLFVFTTSLEGMVGKLIKLTTQ